MAQGDGQDRELERELDQLYRKVAGMDETGGGSATREPYAAAVREGVRGHRFPASSRERLTLVRTRPSFRMSPLGWLALLGIGILAMALLVLLTMPVQFSKALPLMTGTPTVGEDFPRAGAGLTDRDGHTYPLPPGAVVVTWEAVQGSVSPVASVSAKASVAPSLVVDPPAPAAPGPDVAPPVSASSAFPARQGTSTGMAGLVNAPSKTQLPGYALQIRAYPDKQLANAEAYLEEIRQSHPEAFLETVTIEGRGIWHRILLGHFPSEAEAEEYRQRREMLRAYPNSFVQRKVDGRP